MFTEVFVTITFLSFAFQFLLNLFLYFWYNDLLLYVRFFMNFLCSLFWSSWTSRFRSLSRVLCFLGFINGMFFVKQPIQFSVKFFISILSITLTVDLFPIHEFQVMAEVIYCFIIEQPWLGISRIFQWCLTLCRLMIGENYLSQKIIDVLGKRR